MADIEAPDADVAESHDPAATDPVDEVGELGVETPDADAYEQALGDGTARTEPETIRDDVPEADALEQSYAVDLDDDYRA